MNIRVFFTRGLLLICLVLCTFIQPRESQAQSPRAVNVWTQQAKLYAGWSSDYFGSAAALSADGNTLAIGAPEFDKPGDPNPDQGAVYVYVRSGTTWSQQERLTVADTYGGDRFGSAVALSSDGNTLLAGARTQDIGPDVQRGSAYVFARSGTTWTQQQKLHAPDGTDYDEFGGAVAISSDGNTAIIGALGDDTGSIQNHGAAYVFTRSGTSWSIQQKLTSVQLVSEHFGGAVAISNDGNTIAVGVLGRDVYTNSRPGSAYVFTRSGTTWTQQQQLTAADGANDDNFGSAVALHTGTNMLVIGAPGLTNGGTWQGAFYVFQESGGLWTQQQKVTAADVVAGNRFGSTAAINTNGNTILVGAMYHDIGGNADQGAVYVFTRSNGVWMQQQKLIAADGAFQDEFGSAVALNANGSTLAVGARYASVTRREQGATYVFFNPPVYPFSLYLPLVLR